MKTFLTSLLIFIAFKCNAQITISKYNCEICDVYKSDTVKCIIIYCDTYII